MKTTIELPDTLMAQVRHYADARQMTMKAVIEQSVRDLLAKKTVAKSFKLRSATVGGTGLQPDFKAAGWDAIRSAAYQDHGA